MHTLFFTVISLKTYRIDMSKILIIDDEVQIRTLLTRMMELEGYDVCQAGDCRAALKQLELQSPDVALCDVFLPDGNGVDLVLAIKKAAPNVEVILLTAHGNIPDGVQAIKNGAFDYITKGDDNNKIIPLVSRAVEKAAMNARLEKLEKKVGQAYSFDSILGESKSLKDAVSLAQKVSVTDVPVLLTGETQMLLKCIDQFAQTRAVCPGLLAVAPGGLMQEIADYSLMYPQLLALYYRYTGNAAALLPYYKTALGMIRHFAQYERADGLLVQVADKWNLVDWPENLRDDYDFALTRPVVGAGCHNVINALYLGAKKTLNGLARVLGREEPYELEEPVFAYRRAFYRKETGLLADSETSSHTSLHSNVYALYFGLLEEAEEAPVIEFLEKRGFSCGVMLSYYLLLALARRGRYESVYRLLLNDSDHGWCNMLREGATTCFEAWGKDQKWNTSLCHPWASAPVPVILEEIAGIHLSPEGGCDFAPHIPKEVDYFHTSVRMRGKTYTVTKQDGEIHAAIDGIEQSKEM